MSVPDGLTVRAAAPQDAGAIAQIWHAGWREAHLGRVPDALIRARTPGSFADRAAENLDRTAVADGGPAGVVGFVTVAADELEQLYLAADHRGRGAAQALLTEGERRIVADGHATAWLAVVGDNGRARSFYARCGWTDTGPFVHDAPGGIAVPAHRYTRVLGR